MSILCTNIVVDIWVQAVLVQAAHDLARPLAASFGSSRSRVGQAARRELARPLAMPPASQPALTTPPCFRDGIVRMEIGGTLGILDAAGLLECILDFILYHDPIIEPYEPYMTVGHRDLVFSCEGRRYRAMMWFPRGHFGRCGQSCGCCRARTGDDLVVFGCCPECYNGWTFSTLSKAFRIATLLNAWKYCSCQCGGCDASWFEAGWVCPTRWHHEYGEVEEFHRELNEWYERVVAQW